MTRYLVDHLITMQDEPAVVSPGTVDVSNGRVTWSGPSSDAPPGEEPEEHLSGVLIPGFVNTHAHTPMVLLRGAGEGLPVGRWLTEVMWPREGRLTSEDVWWGMTLGAAELLGGGITTTHEMYFFSRSVAEAATAAGIRSVVTPPVLTGDDLARFGTWEEQLAAMVDLASSYADHPLVTVGLGAHSAYAVPEEPLRAVAETAREHGMHVHIHVAEARHEGDGVSEQYGMTVPRYLESIGMLESPLVGAHGLWLTDDDISLFGRHRVGVAHCPMSNGKHASGIAPVQDMREAGIPVGIATDGPSSHDRLDPFEEMRAALRYARLRAEDAAVIGPADVLAMATREAGQVLGRSDLGHLGSGAVADMVLVDADPLGPVVEEADLITHLIYSGSPHLVNSVWVGGERVVQDGQPIRVDIDTARNEVAERARRLATP